MQNFKTINAQDYINASRTTINENFETVQSNNAGTAFPTSNLFEGMKCYRTDLNKTYTLVDVNNRTWVDDGYAEKLSQTVKIAISGGATGTATNFDGSGNITIPVTSLDATKLSGTASISTTGNAATATKATKDSANQQINTTYIKGLSVSGRTITYTKGDGTTGTITTQDNNTTYSNFVKSGSTAAAGLVPKPSTTAGTTKYLREDCTWAVPPDNNTTYSVFVKSGSTAAAGLVPKPSTTAGTTKYLREDGTWQVPPDNNTTYSNMTGATSSAAGTRGLVPAPAAGKQASFLRGDGTWVVPTNTTYSTGTASTSGLTKLYTSLGDNTDGTITQKYLKSIIGSGGGIIAASLAANGYIKFANGLIVQWGSVDALTNGEWSYPVSLTTVYLANVAGCSAQNAGTYSNTKRTFITTITNKKLYFKSDFASGTDYFLVIGK